MMDQKTKDIFINEISAVCNKYGVIISSGADAADDTNLSSWIEVCKITERPGRWPIMETLFEHEQFGTIKKIKDTH